MINLILLSYKARFIITANRILLFLKRLPVIKRAFPQSVFGDSALKTTFVILGVLFVAGKKAFVHTLYMTFLGFAGAFLHAAHLNGGIGEGMNFDGITAVGVVSYALVVWIIISLIGSPLSSVTVSPSNHDNDKAMLNYLRVNPALYAKSRILADNIAGAVLYAPTFAVAFWVAGIPLWGVPVMLAVFAAFRLMGEAVNLRLFEGCGKHFGYTLISVMGSPVYIAALAVPYFFRTPNVAAMLANPLVVLPLVFMGVMAAVYLRSYPLYFRLLTEKVSRNEILYAKARAASGGGALAANLKDAQNWSRKIDKQNLEHDRHRRKSGFAYLNAIFFDRHKRYFAGKILTRCLILPAPLIVAAMVAAYALVIEGQWPADLFLRGEDFNIEPSQLFDFSPIFFFVIYIASMGRVVTASVFSNCDIHMLHYPYYRTAKTILASFKARFYVIVRYNFVVTTVLSISVLGAAALIYGGLNLIYAAVFFVLLSCIGAFFAFNDLFLYYVIQPYDSAGKGKSVVYSIINFVVYVAAYLNFAHARMELVPYTAAVAAVTALYLGLGTALLLSFAPKRFRLR